MLQMYIYKICITIVRFTSIIFKILNKGYVYNSALRENTRKKI